MKIKEKKVLVFGSGISGEAACSLLLREGAEVVLYDGNDKLDREEILSKIPESGNGSLQILLGTLADEKKAQLLKTLDLVVMSPGVPTDLPIVNEMRDRGIPIWGEIELAYEAGKGEVLAITGTNGKTTTTSLLGQIMKNYTENTYVVGNIGNPYTSVALETTEDSVIVAEMSSFQLETIETFRPRVSAILNITPDHLNRHHTMEAYIAAKENIAKNQTEEDTCVLNYEDAVTRQFGETLKAKVLYFSSQRILEEGIYLDGEKIVLSLNGEKTEICTVNELNILGTHNHENAMAAAAMAAAYGVPVEIIRKTLKEFQGVEHRIEFVAEKDGVVYYNDSKGTNPDAAIKGIQAMNRPTVLIGGAHSADSIAESKEKDNRLRKVFSTPPRDRKESGYDTFSTKGLVKSNGKGRILRKDPAKELCPLSGDPGDAQSAGDPEEVLPVVPGRGTAGGLSGRSRHH